MLNPGAEPLSLRDDVKRAAAERAKMTAAGIAATYEAEHDNAWLGKLDDNVRMSRMRFRSLVADAFLSGFGYQATSKGMVGSLKHTFTQTMTLPEITGAVLLSVGAACLAGALRFNPYLVGIGSLSLCAAYAILSSERRRLKASVGR